MALHQLKIPSRRGRLTGTLGAALVIALAATIWASTSGSANRVGTWRAASASGIPPVTVGPISTTTLSGFRSDLIAHLHRANLNFHWVVCVPTGSRFRGVRVVRCNVDFGEPHIQAYCSVLSGGRLLTSQEDPAIPCGHDNAGWSDPVIQYG